MATASGLPLNNSDLDFLLSLSDWKLETWLTTLNRSLRVQLIDQLSARAETRNNLSSPAALAQLAWGRNWMMGRHLERLNQVLVDLAERRIRRLLVMMPPRHGKSVLVSQFFPAWYLGTHPDQRVILASYEAHFAASWGRKARDLLEVHGKKCFGVGVRSDSSAANRWDLADRFGGMSTAGVGGPITGRGADLLIVDDPVKNAEQATSEVYRDKAWDWWTSTAFTRLEPGGVAVLVQTRWHEEDLAGLVLREQSEEDWYVVRFPAIAEDLDCLGRTPGEALWPDRFDKQQLEGIQRSIPKYWWEALYQQRPGRHEHVLWPREYFEGEDLWFDEWPDDLVLRVMTLDPSKGSSSKRSDYSAYVLLGVQTGGGVWVEADMSNSRAPMQLVEDGAKLFQSFGPHAFRVESNAWQDLLSPLFQQAFQQRGLLAVQPGAIFNSVKKELRIEKLEGLLRARQLHFRRTPSTQLLVKQLRDFPFGTHDDGPDALEMAVRTAQELWAGGSREVISHLSMVGER